MKRSTRSGVARSIAAALVLTGTTGFGPAHAALVPFTFTGIVDVVVGPELATVAGIGDTFVLTFNVETTTPDSSADVGVGRYSNAVTDFSFEVGSYSGTSLFPVTFQVTNDFMDGRDSVEVVARNLDGGAVGPYTPDELRLQLVDRSGTAFSSDALPDAQIDPADFDDPRGFTFLTLTFDNTAGPSRGAISSELQPHVVPLPAAVWGFVVALGALFRLRGQGARLNRLRLRQR